MLIEVLVERSLNALNKGFQRRQSAFSFVKSYDK